MTIVVIALVAVAAAQASTPATLPGEACTPSALVGTWKVIEAKQGTETIPTGPTDPTSTRSLRQRSSWSSRLLLRAHTR